MPVLDTLHAEAIEDSVFSKPAEQVDVERLYMIWRDLLRIRNAVAPLVEVCRRLEHAEVKPIDPANAAAVSRRHRSCAARAGRNRRTARSLGVCLGQPDAGASAANGHHLAWAAILAVPTAIAGIYGMNFEFMPELKWSYGYFLVIGVIIVICGTLYWRLRRNGWL